MSDNFISPSAMSDKPENPSIAAVTVSHSSDLRDRIAAVIQENLVWEAPNMSARLADAVIEAVLRLERGQRSKPDGPLWGSDNRYNVTRYVTEWTPDE